MTVKLIGLDGVGIGMGKGDKRKGEGRGGEWAGEIQQKGSFQRLLMMRGPVMRSKRRRSMVLLVRRSWRTRQGASDRVPSFYKPPATVFTHMSQVETYSGRAIEIKQWAQ